MRVILIVASIVVWAVTLVIITESGPPAQPTVDPFTVILKQRRLIAQSDKIIEIILKQRHMVAVDDELLNGFMHGTWDRSCDYEVVPGELLADGSIRETVYQICPEDE